MSDAHPTQGKKTDTPSLTPNPVRFHNGIIEYGTLAWNPGPYNPEPIYTWRPHPHMQSAPTLEDNAHTSPHLTPNGLQLPLDFSTLIPNNNNNNHNPPPVKDGGGRRNNSPFVGTSHGTNNGSNTPQPTTPPGTGTKKGHSHKYGGKK